MGLPIGRRHLAGRAQHALHLHGIAALRAGFGEPFQEFPARLLVLAPAQQHGRRAVAHRIAADFSVFAGRAGHLHHLPAPLDLRGENRQLVVLGVILYRAGHLSRAEPVGKIKGGRQPYRLKNSVSWMKESMAVLEFKLVFLKSGV